MKSSLNIKRPFFSKLTVLEYHADSLITHNNQSYILECFLKEILPIEALTGKKIRDLKGKDTYGKSGDKISEILLGVTGYVTHDDEGEPYEESLAFEVTITTEFDSFEGSHHIIHSCNTHIDGSLPDYVELRNLGTTIGLKLETLFLGLELFESRFTASSFGYAPVVTQSLSCKVDEKTATLDIKAELKKGQGPFPHHFEAIGAGFERAIGQNPYKDFLEKRS